MANWDEVKRLAADFQKIQLSSTTQRLSERNCIEIIQWLMQKKMVDLIYTSDGKEYMTPAHLVSEIRGELYVNGGRVNLTDLAKSIGVDLSHINNNISEVLKGHKDIHSVLGQLIDNSYIIRIAGEINEKLIQQGQINVNDLTIQYDLPAEFLQVNILEKHLGKIIQGKQDKSDPRVFFTESFITRTKAKIRGALIAITRPTPVSAIVSNIGISEKLFFSLFDDKDAHGSLTSKLTGAQYVPNIYSKSQNEWVNNFYKQNGYLEFDALARLGITDCKTYLKKQFVNESLTFLDSCVVSKSILERAEVDVEECISSKSHLDLESNLPSVLNEKDIKMILDLILVGQRLRETVVFDNYIMSQHFVNKLTTSCEDIITTKVKQVVESGAYRQYKTSLLVAANKGHRMEHEVEEVKVDKREERRKKATGGKSGGGTQGRETKTKSTKKGGRSRVADSPDEQEPPEKKTALQIITFEDVRGAIQNQVEEEGLDDIADQIANNLLDGINQKALESAESLYVSTLAENPTNRRQTHNEIQEKLNTILGDIRLYEKGAKLFPAETQQQLFKYLLKTQCSDFVNKLLNYLSSESGREALDPSQTTHEQRTKIVNEFPGEYKVPMQKLLKTLTGSSIEEFSVAAEAGLQSASMILMKIDKKKDRVTVLNHKHALLDQLNKSDDPAIALHLAVLVLFITVTQQVLHASGKFVSSILAFLRQNLAEDMMKELTSFYDLVTQSLSDKAAASLVEPKLSELMPSIKKMANEYRKQSSSSADKN